MSFRKKIFMSFMLIIIIPICMVALVGKMIITYQLNSIQQNFNMALSTTQVISNPMQMFNRFTRGTYNRIILTAKQSPELFEDNEYLEELNNELNNNYSFLAVRKADEFVYSGNQTILSIIKDQMPVYGAYHTDSDGGIYISSKTPVLVKQQDFVYSDGSEGTIFIITDLTNIIPQLKTSAIQAVVSFALILVLTATIISFWIYSGMIRPINRLRTAMQHVKEGDLNFSAESDQCDEIGQLCDDFEEMRKHLKEQIEVRMQYEKDTQELISNISHDLKTPITAIKGYTEGIMDGVADTPERMDKYIKTIYTKANDMSALVDELAFYSKIDCNTVPYNFAPISVTEYFNDCVEDLRLDIETKDIEMVYENNLPENVRVTADVEQLKRVVNNIVGNAVKFTRRDEMRDEAKKLEKGRICIRVEDAGEFVKIEVEDNGLGIAKEDLPHIFERFYRADASRNTKTGGSGLGLAISRKIIEDHGGSIWAFGAQGVGTKISFTLKKWNNNAEPPQKEG